MRLPGLLLICCAALTGLSASEGGGLAFGPALILVRDIPVGRSFTLGEAAKVRYQVVNNSDAEAVYGLQVVVPSTYTFGEFEKGYEPAPELGWFRLDREEVTVPAKGRVEVDLTIDIPDRPELRNRHWIVAIEAGQPAKMALGSALRLRARLMLETAISSDAAAASGREIGLAPAQVAMRQEADGSWAGEVLLRNGSDAPAEFDLLATHEVYPGPRLEKAHRYFQRIDQAVLGERWASAEGGTVSLAAGESRTVRFTAPAQPALAAGGMRQEVLFVSRRVRGEALPKRSFAVGDRMYERMELLRLRYDSTTPDPAAR